MNALAIVAKFLSGVCACKALSAGRGRRWEAEASSIIHHNYLSIINHNTHQTRVIKSIAWVFQLICLLFAVYSGIWFKTLCGNIIA